MKDERLFIRIDSELKAKAKEVADSKGMGLSEYILELIKKDVKKSKKG